jgi:sterol desaturase/sphingolipid hydroxylase (fatty acid hydroxylase superfamily)
MRNYFKFLFLTKFIKTREFLSYAELTIAIGLVVLAIINKQGTLIFWQTFVALFVLFIIILSIERLTSCYRGVRYLEVSFITDLSYTFLVIGGIYGLFQQPFITWVDSILRQYDPFLYLNGIQNLPKSAQLIVFLITVDFCRYWKHRFLHSISIFQAFHSIHHATDNLNFLTTYRIHLVEYLIDGLVTLIPVVLLGIPPEMSIPLYLTLILYGAINHSGLNLSFGWLDRIFVSPRFHALHHSIDRNIYNTNFGSLFSVWDIIFGTANYTSPWQRAYGLPGLQMPSSLTGQLLFPIKLIIKNLRYRKL